jgi:hypothetical protein
MESACLYIRDGGFFVLVLGIAVSKEGRIYVVSVGEFTQVDRGECRLSEPLTVHFSAGSP